jgi:hypothetical protein
MNSRSRGSADDLAADLRADLARKPVIRIHPNGPPGVEPGLQTTVRFTPSHWRRPGLAFRRGGFFSTFGPLTLELRRLSAADPAAVSADDQTQ